MSIETTNSKMELNRVQEIFKMLRSLELLKSRGNFLGKVTHMLLIEV